jgi:transposase
VPGRTTNVRASEWLARLRALGLLRRSFVPSAAQRESRDVVRYRKRLIEDRAREANRVQKVLETANIKLASVVTDVLGVSARAMRKAPIAGIGTPEELADLAQRRMRRKRAALGEAITGRVTGHHRFMLELSPRLVISSPVETSPIDQLARSPSCAVRRTFKSVAHITGRSTASSVVYEVWQDLVSGSPP